MSYAFGFNSVSVTSATSHSIFLVSAPRRFLQTRMAVSEISSTVILRYPRDRRSSASVDSPPPTSIIAEEGPAPVRSMRERDVSRWGWYQLRASGALVLYTLSQCVFTSIRERTVHARRGFR